MKVGLCTLSNEDESVESVLRSAAEAGYDGVEIWGKEPHIGDKSAQLCESIVDVCTALSLDISVYGSYLCAGAESFSDDYKRELTVAEDLEADILRVWPGKNEYGDHSESEWNAAVRDLHRLSEQAADRDIAITVEKHAGRLTDKSEGARRLIEAVDHPNCGLNWQPLFRMSERELLEEAETLAPLCNNVHIQAPAERGGDRRALLKDAYFDVQAAIERLKEGGLDGYIEVEFVTQTLEYEDAIQRDRNYLESII